MSRIFKTGKSTMTSYVLNVIGMAMAFAALYLISVQVGNDLGYNRKIKDSDRIYAIGLPSWFEKGKYFCYLNRPVWEKAISEIPCVESGGCGNVSGYSRIDICLDESAQNKFTLRNSKVSPGFIETFSFEAVSGSLDMVRGDKEIAISESKAKELGLETGSVIYFLQKDGKMTPVSIVAIFKDMPVNCDLYGIDIMQDIGDRNIDDFGQWNSSYFVKLHSPLDKELFEKQSLQIAKSLMLEEYGRRGEEITEKDLLEADTEWACRLFPIKETYFSKILESPGKSGNKGSALTLAAIAVLILAVTFINFVNFFFALVPVRLKSTNIRKILGASRSSLVAGIAAESAIMTVIALILAGAVVKAYSGSTFASLISYDTSILSNVPIAVTIAVSVLALSVLLSLYPALYLTSFPPEFALKGSFGTASKGKAFRMALIGFQFAISISLIICASFINMQRQYMMHYDMGFDRNQLLEVKVSEKAAQSYHACTDLLKSDPRIKDVTWAERSILDASAITYGRDFKGEEISFAWYPVTWNFLDFMGIEIMEGRDFTRSDEKSRNGVYIFNESARDKYGLTLEDKIEGYLEHTEIAGFCKDFNFESLESEIGPLALYVFGDKQWTAPTTLYVRTAENADIPAVFRHIRSSVQKLDPSVAPDEIDIKFFDSSIDAKYTKEKNASIIITLFTVLSIMISLMGVFGLVMFESEHRRKEIGIRRVNGANVMDILAMFNMKFLKIVLICFVIAAPVSWYVTDIYLSTFAYRMPVHWWVFALALVAVLAVTSTVVTLRSLSAILSDPVGSIRNE